MTTITKPYSEISLAECVDLIASVGDKVIVFPSHDTGQVVRQRQARTDRW